MSVSGAAAMSRLVGSLYVAGASIVLASLVFPQPPGTRVPFVLGLCAVAYVGGAVLLALRDRLRDWAMPPALAFGTGLISFAMIATPHRTGVYALFYVWVAVCAAYFLTWLQVGLQVVGIAACYGLALAVQGPEGAAEQWVIGIGTVAVVALLVGGLRRGVAGLFARLADSARTDPLTELLNRRGFVELLELEIERARRTDRPVSLLVIDLDDFKSVNERFGHATGDSVLRSLGRALPENFRRIDRAARTAGEEFAVVLPETDGHTAYLLAERLRRRLADELTGDRIQLSVSIGVATSPKHGLTTEDLLHAGERALFAAKSLGRDRAVMYDPEIVSSLIAAGDHGAMRREENIAAVMVLAETLDMRDTGTARHSQTVARYASLIGARLELAPAVVERLRLAGLLHDIGKIGVQDSILRKPGPLTDEEYEEMKRHSELGARILAGANLEDISAWVLAHHERPDGRGYPNGLADHEIPIEAKVLAVADSYEAMTSDRVYRLSLGHDAAQEELRRCSGTQFDARVVEALIEALAAEPVRA